MKKADSQKTGSVGRVDVVIGGAGFAGLALAIALREGLGDSFARGWWLAGPLPGVRAGRLGSGLVGVLPSAVVPARLLLLRMRPLLPRPLLVPSSALLPPELPRDPTRLLLASRPPPDIE